MKTTFAFPGLKDFGRGCRRDGAAEALTAKVIESSTDMKNENKCFTIL